MMDEAQDRSAQSPLDGILVVDLSRYLPGPLASRLLADLGARVIKVEEPTYGDPVRQSIPKKDGRSALAALLLAGHESLAFDLKAPKARESFEQLLSHADVLLESFRPGTLARLGLPPDELRRRFPELILCSVSGFGQEGPLAPQAGHDLTYQALAGSLSSAPRMPGVQVADMVGGWSAAMSIVAALYRRQKTGHGCRIDQSLLDAAGHANLTAWAGEADEPKPVGEPLLLTGALPSYSIYRTRDGASLAVGILEPKFWRRFCDLVGRADLVAGLVKTSSEAMRRELTDLIASRSRREWEDLLAEEDLPVAPVLSCAEALEHPQVRHRGLLHQSEDGLPRLGFPALFDGERPRGGSECPGLGEQTAALTEEFDLLPTGHDWRRRSGIGRRRSLKRWALGQLHDWFGRR